MRFVSLSLLGYVVFVAGVLLALWRAGVLSRVAPMWMAIGLVIAIGLGIMFAIGSRDSSITSEGD